MTGSALDNHEVPGVANILDFLNWRRGRRGPRAAAEPVPPPPSPTHPPTPLEAVYLGLREEGHRVGLVGPVLEDAKRLQTLSDLAQVKITAIWQPAFDPAKNAADRTLQVHADDLFAQLTTLRTARDTCDALRRDLALQAPEYRKPPKPPYVLMGTGVLTSAVAIGSTIRPLIDVPDEVLAWGAALTAGAAVGLVTLSLLFHRGHR